MADAAVLQAIDFLRNLIGQILDLLKGSGGGLTDVQAGMIQTILANVNTLGLALQNGITALDNHITASTNTLQRSVSIVDQKIDALSNGIPKALEGLGTVIANALNTSLTKLGTTLGDIVSKIVGRDAEAFDKAATKIEGAINRQTQAEQLAFALISSSIDSLRNAQQTFNTILHQDIDTLTTRLITSNDQNTKILDKRIQDTFGGLVEGVKAITGAEQASAVAIATAIAIGCSEIAAAITAAQAADKILKGATILKEFEVLEKVLTIATAITGILEITNPDQLMTLLLPVIEAYQKVGQTATESLKT